MKELVAIGAITLAANIIAALVVALFQAQTERQDWHRRESEMRSGGIVIQ